MSKLDRSRTPDLTRSGAELQVRPSRYLEPSGYRLLDSLTWDRVAASLHLSRRELEVTQGVFDEATEAQIARRLGISAHTVHMYAERLYHKLDVHSRVALVLRVISERDFLGFRSSDL